MHQTIKSINKSKLNLLSHHKFCTYSFAILRDIDDSIVEKGIRSVSSNDLINIGIARKQHEYLKRKLESIGLEVYQLKSNGHPDSVFIEDTAIIIDNRILFTCPGAISRRPEVDSIRNFFINFEKRKLIMTETLPFGQLDGGDVLFTGSFVFYL